MDVVSLLVDWLAIANVIAVASIGLRLFEWR